MINQIALKITEMWGDWYSYTANSINECRDEVDKSMYFEMANGNDKCICCGHTLYERI